MLHCLHSNVQPKDQGKRCSTKGIKRTYKALSQFEKESWEFIDSQYVVQFEVFGKKGNATFTEKGRILNSEIQVTKDDLPFSIGYYIKKNHDNEKIQIASKLKDTAGAISYHIVIPDFMLTFNAAGEFVNEVSTTTEEVTEEQTETPTQN